MGTEIGFWRSRELGWRTYIGNSTIDISKLLQAEQSSCVSRIIEREALQRQLASKYPVLWGADTDGRGIDGNSSCIGSRIWLLSYESLSVLILEGRRRGKVPACNCRVSKFSDSTGAIVDCVEKSLKVGVVMKKMYGHKRKKRRRF